MTADHDRVVDAIEWWLSATEVEEDPEAVLQRVVTEIEDIPQRRSPWTGMLSFDTGVLVGIGMGAAATLLAVFVGAQLLDMPTGAGDQAPGPAVSAADSGYIAFTQATYDLRERVADDVRIVAVSSDGGDPKVLAVPPGTDWRLVPSGGTFDDARNTERVGPSVSWSPDGTQIAFRLFNDAPGIYLMNWDGSELRRLVDLPQDHDSGMGYSAALDWSPDGTRIAYSYPYGALRSPLYVVDAAGGTVTSLTGPNAAEGVTRTVAWSPDGSMIAFVRTDQGPLPRGSALFVMNADGTGLRQLPTGSEPNRQVTGLAWSPDASTIAFTQEMGNATAVPPEDRVLRAVNADGTGLRDLSGPPEAGGCCWWASPDERVAWSPDGTSVAMLRWPEDGRDIVIVNADGSGERTITGSGDFSWFDWSPDGSELVLFDDDSNSIFVVGADGSGQRWVANGEFPTWAPAPGQR